MHVLIGMFDRDQSGTIELHEFQGLWNYLSQWRTLFDQFDRDRSGTIDAGELNTGLLCSSLQWLGFVSFEKVFLWSPYVIGQTIIFLPCDFYLLSFFFFPCLISAAVDWMSTILPHMV